MSPEGLLLSERTQMVDLGERGGGQERLGEGRERKNMEAFFKKADLRTVETLMSLI